MYLRATAEFNDIDVDLIALDVQSEGVLGANALVLEWVYHRLTYWKATGTFWILIWPHAMLSQSDHGLV